MWANTQASGHICLRPHGEGLRLRTYTRTFY